MPDGSSKTSEQIAVLKEILRQLEGRFSALAQERIALESRASSALSWIIVLLITALSVTAFSLLNDAKTLRYIRYAPMALGFTQGGCLYAVVAISYYLSSNRTWHMVGSVPHLPLSSEPDVLSNTIKCYEMQILKNEESLNHLQWNVSHAIRTVSFCVGVSAILFAVIYGGTIAWDIKHPVQVPSAPVAASPDSASQSR
jgi:hypothetical protein